MNLITGEDYKMNYDLFSRLFKYRQNETNSPLENFITEQFAYILQYLIEQKNDIVYELFELFNIPLKVEDIYKVKVETQWETWVERYSHYARPDIKVSIGNDIYFIEVKVDSDLNQYESFDQIQLYEAIDVLPMKNNGIRTLTKYQICTKDKSYQYFKESHKVFWRQIYALFRKNEFNLQDDILVNNFLLFLEENDMSEKTTLNYSKDGLSNFYSLYGFLNDVLQDFASREGYTAKALKFDGSKDWFGFNIAYSGKAVVWIGCINSKNDTEEKDCIVITSYANEEQLLDRLNIETHRKKIIKTDYNGYSIFAKLFISDILEKTTFEEQKEVFDNWIKNNFIAEILAKSWDIISE